MVAISQPWYNGSYTIAAKPIKTLESHYTMIQFLINTNRRMPELCLKKIFTATILVPTGVPEKRVRVAKSQQQLGELPDDSTDIFKSNIIDPSPKWRPKIQIS